VDIEQLAGTKLGNYEIESLLGRGGMGVVYKATQISLSRSVALKFLPPELIDSREWKERFHREAQAAAALAHPNICTIHEIDEADDRVFIAMECLEGQSLDKKIESGPLDIDEAINIALRVAEGLRHAHKRGIIHRDIKPANIMVTEDGQAKIMDFGLAKLSDKTRLTKTATVMGTIAYMSPEQARGDKDIGHQTDIWSLGVVLYEMLTGMLPFDAETNTGLIYKIINEDPEPIRNHRGDLPGPLVSIVEKTTQKNSQSRYGDAEELISELETVKSETSVSVESSSPSIAVLPFVDMSPAKDQEYFCDGIAEELINALTQIADLRVIARTSAFSFKGKNINVRDIGRELDVGSILEGSVRKAGNRLRITAQLVDTARGHHLWSEKYDRELEDIFAVQDEISEAIVDRLKPRLLREEKTKPAKRETVNMEAYNLYLRGRYFWNKMTDESIQKALKFFECAIEIDADYAIAYVGLADSYQFLANVASIAPQEVYPKAREAIETALELDDTLAEAHASLAIIRMQHEWDWEGAEREYLRAIELNPGYANAHQWHAVHLMFVGRFSEAITRIKRALELDPFSLFINRDYAMILLYSSHFDEAVKQCQKTIEMDPTFGWIRGFLAVAYFRTSMLEEASVEIEKLRAVPEVVGDWGTEFLQGMLCAYTGKRDEARQTLHAMMERSKHLYVSAYIPATMCFALGDNDEGFKWLNKAYENRDPFLCFLKVNQETLSVGSDPRYFEMLKKIGLAD
jgi:serine/threonine protein kinase/Tfp pilus assembly protein PilF